MYTYKLYVYTHRQKAPTHAVAALREELMWGPHKMQELRDGVVRLVKSVSGAAAARDVAEEAAARERLTVERLRYGQNRPVSRVEG